MDLATVVIPGYYNYFPPKNMNISVTTRAGQTLKQILVVTKDFKAGDVIYRVSQEPNLYHH